MFLALFALFFTFDALALETDPAEYRRVSADLHSLAARNAWTGVERAYQAILKTNVPLSFEDEVAGAHASSALGQVTEARARLQRAHDLREDRKVIEWMWEIDSSYGQVQIQSDPDARMEVQVMPFNPHAVKAIQVATTEVRTKAHFDGHLPEGVYQISEQQFAVRPALDGRGIKVDARTPTKVAYPPLLGSLFRAKSYKKARKQRRSQDRS